MRFLSKETCQRLVKIGCVSHSGFYYNGNGDIGFSFVHNNDPSLGTSNSFLLEDEIRIFILEDFLGTHEAAIENCKKVWGEIPVLDDIWVNFERPIEFKEDPAWVYMRHKILNSSDWVKFIEDEVKEME